MELEKYVSLIENNFKGEFERLYEYLTEYNKKVNLTAITEKREVFIKHFLDSAVGEKYFTLNAAVAEVGSGGGFPSIPLKILRPDLNFTLIESTGKKCRYLEDCVDNFKLKSVKVVNARAEELAREPLFRESFDFCTARAVARLNILCEYCLPFVNLGGKFIAYKGDCADEVKESLKAIKVLGGELENVEEYTLPNGEKRALVIIKKVTHTDKKYPRGQGKERKSPIV